MATLPRDSAHQVVHLLVVSGPDTGRMLFLKPKQEARIGRAPSCALRLTDPGVSAKHCIVRSAGDVAFVEDLKSRMNSPVLFDGRNIYDPKRKAQQGITYYGIGRGN